MNCDVELAAEVIVTSPQLRYCCSFRTSSPRRSSGPSWTCTKAWGTRAEPPQSECLPLPLICPAQNPCAPITLWTLSLASSQSSALRRTLSAARTTTASHAPLPQRLARSRGGEKDHGTVTVPPFMRRVNRMRVKAARSILCRHVRRRGTRPGRGPRETDTSGAHSRVASR